jgi:hypothetical protein
MDYSLLVIVETNQDWVQMQQRKKKTTIHRKQTESNADAPRTTSAAASEIEIEFIQ